MSRAPQKRRLETRARLLAAASELVGEGGFDALRVEEVVLRAGVAKGTFFSHFGDKDALMAEMIGERLASVMDDLKAALPPKDAAGMADALDPLIEEMASERVVFDIVLRYSGAAGVTDIGPIAQNFIDQVYLFVAWVTPLRGVSIRDDVDVMLQAEGIQAFLLQAIALSYCAVEGQVDRRARLRTYLDAWLTAA